jgi:hypothetical protein
VQSLLVVTAYLVPALGVLQLVLLVLLVLLQVLVQVGPHHLYRWMLGALQLVLLLLGLVVLVLVLASETCAFQQRCTRGCRGS